MAPLGKRSALLHKIERKRKRLFRGFHGKEERGKIVLSVREQRIVLECPRHIDFCFRQPGLGILWMCGLGPFPRPRGLRSAGLPRASRAARRIQNPAAPLPGFRAPVAAATRAGSPVRWPPFRAAEARNPSMAQTKTNVIRTKRIVDILLGCHPTIRASLPAASMRRGKRRRGRTSGYCTKISAARRTTPVPVCATLCPIAWFSLRKLLFSSRDSSLSKWERRRLVWAVFSRYAERSPEH